MKAVAFAHDGRGPKTSLLPALLEHLKMKDASELISWAYTSLEWSRISAVSFICQQEALKGDQVAIKIINKVCQGLADSVQPVVSQLEISSKFPIVLAGSVFTHEGSVIGKNVKEILSNKYPNANVIFPVIDECLAAALLAKNQFNLNL